MRLGLYIFVSLVFMGMVGGLAYMENPNFYLVEVMGINFNFPIALWFVLPMVLFFIMTVSHMFFYGLKNYFLLKKWRKDTVALENALYWSLVNEPKDQKYAINEVRSSAVLLAKSTLVLNDTVEGLSPRLSRVVNIIQKIKNGEYVDLKELKMTKVFNAGNPILIQNRLNRLESDNKFVEDVMRAASDYSEMVQKEALEIFSRKEDFVKARKYVKVFDVKNFLVMLQRVQYDERLGLTPEIVSEFVDVLDLKCEDFITIASITKKYFKPDENLLLFKAYQDKNEKAQNAYLYLLFEYELLDQVLKYLEEHDENDFMKFRALYTLKQEHGKFKLEDIIDIKSICNEKRFY
ncbi:Arginine/ornithine antiporter ArcD [hydrothermal vent metagenome]|uniref:Arginine/ornithine antiporter ArcD n=1 Tax=hydrothermal vent metagenome TaxID=652676 RepID=A0A1W1BIW2_9ZZZZ